VELIHLTLGPQLFRIYVDVWVFVVLDIIVDDIRWVVVKSVKSPPHGPVEGQNCVFDANVTGLSYVEPDLFRAEAMQYWMDNLVALFGR
jgi:hypothetical protein